MIRAISIRNGKKAEIEILPLHDEFVLSDDDVEFIETALEEIDEDRTRRFHRVG